MKKKPKAFGVIRKSGKRSKLEEYCDKRLKQEKLEACYECKTFTLQDKVEFDSFEKLGKTFKKTTSIRPITYTPDFVGKDWIIEVKGFFTESAKIKWKLFKKHLLDNNLNYKLFLPTSQKEIELTIKIILENGRSEKTVS